METVYDWLTVALFAALAVLFLQRSMGTRPENDRVVNYIPPALGCGLANYLGNNGYALLAVLVIVAVIAYIWFVLKPGRADLPR
ncbi:MAG: hypothetical protein QM688_02470 [Sphingomonas bacterium]